MLRFRNLLWVFNKNTYVSLLLMIIAISFAIYVNYQSVSHRLNSNTQLVTNYIQGQFNQYKSRLELVSHVLEAMHLKELRLKEFASVYVLDIDGKVLAKNTIDQNDHINRFIQINNESVPEEGIFASRLVYSKNIKPSVYLAMRLSPAAKANMQTQIGDAEPAFVCARVEITDFLKGVVTFDAGYLVTDSHENILYSSRPELITAGTNIGSMSNLLSIQGIFDGSSVMVAKVSELSGGFYIRSFLGKAEFFSTYLTISLLLLAVFLVCLYSFYLDKKTLKVGLIDQLNYCLNLLKSEKIDQHQFVHALLDNDVRELQKQIALTMQSFAAMKEEYHELDQRLGSMFSKSQIPMLMIDALNAKIHKANDAALEFYDQKLTAIRKMNLYMLANASEKFSCDPMVLASNLQNCIKNHGGYIKAHHFASGVHKEVKIYPFVMRSERFSYDTLMIIDNDMVAKNLANLTLRNEALANSFICNMELGLIEHKLSILNFNNVLLRHLGTIALKNRPLKKFVHPSCIPALARLMHKLRAMLAGKNIESRQSFETVLYLRQEDGYFAEFKSNFVMFFDQDLKPRMYAVLSHVRSNLSSFEVQTSIDYHDIYQNAKEYIAILDAEFRFLSINTSLASLIDARAKSLSSVISPRTMGALEAMRQGSSKETFVELLDADGKYHACKFKYLCSKSARGEPVYAVYFQEDFYSPVLGEFAAFMRKKGCDVEEQICEFYKGQTINAYIAHSSLAALSHYEGLDKLKEMYLQALKK